MQISEYQHESGDRPDLSDFPPLPPVRLGPGGEYRRDYTPSPSAHGYLVFIAAIVVIVVFLLSPLSGLGYLAGLAVGWVLSR